MGAFVVQVGEDSPADIAGIRRGDIITQIGETPLDNDHSFIYALFNYSAGETINLQVSREIEGNELSENPLLDITIFNYDVQLENGRYEFPLQWIADSELRGKVADIHVNHPTHVCKAMRKKVYKKGGKNKTWRQSP